MWCYTDLLEVWFFRGCARWRPLDADNQSVSHTVQPDDVLYAVYYRHFERRQGFVERLRDRGLISYDEDVDDDTYTLHSASDCQSSAQRKAYRRSMLYSETCLVVVSVDCT
jgi:hypothetical protein